jgi:SSS family solute:Na+ symporter
MSSALVIIAAVTVFALYLGLRAKRGHDMSLEQWTVGGRSFGTAFVFLLMAGEIYTTFTFLGGSGFAYGKGAPVYYILAYGSLAYILSYWMLPPIWRFAKAQRLVSQPHFFTRKYDSPALGVLVALVGVAALIPYLVLQLKGLGIIVDFVNLGGLDRRRGGDMLRDRLGRAGLGVELGRQGHLDSGGRAVSRHLFTDPLLRWTR